MSRPDDPAHPLAEVPLAGGRVAPVVRVGDTVRRQAGPWTPAVHALLSHLAERGFDAAPLPRGRDDRGREVLQYLPGETVGDPDRVPWPGWVWDDGLLADAAALLRRYHDAVRDFRPARPLTWRGGTRVLHPGQLVCHNDWAPYNVVVTGGRLSGVIDWDVAGPSLPASDLAFAAYAFVPLHHPAKAERLGAPTAAAVLARRLDTVLARYGPDAPRDRFLERVAARVRSSVTAIRTQAGAGHPGFRAMVDSGYVAGLERDLAWVREQASRLAP